MSAHGGVGHPISDVRWVAPTELHTELFRQLSAQYFWCAILRLWVSRGLAIERIHANCIVRKQNLATFPVFSATDSVTYELAVIENGLPATVVC
jgi:hypothetical protein